jgi:hypothetical protein
MLRTSFLIPELAGRGRGGSCCGCVPGSVCCCCRLGGRGEWYSQGTSAAAAKGDNCAKCESRKAERVGSDGKVDCGLVGLRIMFISVCDVVFVPSAVVKSGGAKG